MLSHSSTTDFRIALGLRWAERSRRDFPKPKPSNTAAKLGLRYENNVGKELTIHVKRGNFRRIEHNPWFTFSDDFGTANCSPDFLLWEEQGITVVEVKLTWVDVAIAKLMDLYGPVVSHALNAPVRFLVICRNLTPAAPSAKHSLREALESEEPLLQWMSNGHILW